MSDDGWVPGEYLGLDIPAHADALRAAGGGVLTKAFRTSGAMGAGATVRAIAQLEEFRGGSTGRKALLSVEYDGASDLPSDLFVKFSRDLDDPGRDRGRAQMEFEVRFALLSRTPGFPIAVPGCLFADYHAPTGTGVLITDRIPYGANGIEHHYDKCMDRLAGVHKAGRLPAALVEHFPVDMQNLSVGERVPYTAEQLQRRQRVVLAWYLDLLLEHFATEFRAAGGPLLDTAMLKRYLTLYAAIMGCSWLLDVPSYLLRLLDETVANRSTRGSPTTSRPAAAC